MKILIVTAGFFPAKNYGGPPVSIDNMCSLLKGNINFFILTSNHELGKKDILDEIEDDKWNDRDNCKVYYASNSLKKINLFLKIIDEVSPDIVYLNSVFSTYVFPCLSAAYKKKCRVILAPRGELCKGALKKKIKKLPYLFLLKRLNLLKNVYFQSTSNEEFLSIKKHLTNDSAKILSLSNIPMSNQSNNIHKKKANDQLKLIFFSRIVRKKNLLFAIELLTKIKENVCLDIYGPIEDEKYWLQCRNSIEKLPPNIIVKYCGLLEHNKISTTIKNYDAFLFPTFSENYGHVIIESLSNGCPVILSKDTTPWDDIDNYCGFVASLDDKEKFIEIIKKMCSMNDDELLLLKENSISYYERKFDLKSLKNNYIEKFDYVKKY